MFIFNFFKKKPSPVVNTQIKNEPVVKKYPDPVVIRCPNCNAELDKFPQARSKCKSCGSWYRPKKDPRDKTIKIVTDEQARQFDEIYYGARNEKLDQEWEEIKKRIKNLESQTNPNWQDLALAYRSMAYHERRVNIPRDELIIKALQCDLQNYKNQHIIKVEILASIDACPVCKSMNGKIITVEQALITMPLPIVSPNDPNHICRCSYLPVV